MGNLNNTTILSPGEREFIADEAERQGWDQQQSRAEGITPELEQSIAAAKDMLQMAKKIGRLADSSLRMVKKCFAGAEYLKASGEYEKLTDLEKEWIDEVIAIGRMRQNENPDN